MEIVCNFGIVEYNFEDHFTCVIEDQQIPENCELKLIGQYQDRKTNNDVVFVKFENCIVTKVPQGLTKSFPNMNKVQISDSNFKKVCKNDLVEYKNLKVLNFNYNWIEFLSGDLFEEF